MYTDMSIKSWIICFRKVDVERKENVKSYVTKYSETETHQTEFHQFLER